MDLEKIQSIQLSLLKKETDVENNVAEYSKKLTAKFTLPIDFPRTDEYFSLLLNNMYSDLMKNAPEDCDSIGIWIDIGSIILDNALPLQTLDDIKMYSKEDINVAYEFFKMSMIS